MLLSELISRSSVVAESFFGDAEIIGMSDDSRTCSKAYLFVNMPSNSGDTEKYISAAAEQGAIATIVHSDEGVELARSLNLAVAKFKTKDSNFIESVAMIARSFFGDPSQSLRVIGITGTNGKTTTALMISNALTALGRNSAYLGTLGYISSRESIVLENTTPFPIQLNRLLARARDEGNQDFVMEVSSHALEEQRVAGVRFEIGIFTNLSQDHLDFHPSMEAYENAKKSLFTEYGPKGGKCFSAALGTDDVTAQKWKRSELPNAFTFALHDGDLRAEVLEVRFDGVKLRLICGNETAILSGQAGGDFNIANYLSATSALLLCGYSLHESAAALEQAPPVPGRFEAVKNNFGFGVIVDYAHTPDALAKLLTTARKLTNQNLITVFGCGGDRDKSKRPKMARVVSEIADVSIVTSDNPRTEDPEAIVNEVCTGLIPGARYEKVVDRREAIQRAIQLASEGDCVVIAGKGHEDYQIIGRTKFPMDDRQLAREALNELEAITR